MDLTYQQALGSALSQLLNAIIGGHPDETLSARAWRMKDKSENWHRVYLIAERLFGPGHCEESREADVDRAHYVLEMEQ